MNEDARLVADIKTIFLKIMQQNVTLMALPDEPDDEQPIAALSVLGAHSRNDEMKIQVS